MERELFLMVLFLKKEKIKAVEKVLTEDVERATPPAAPQKPANGKELKMPSFFDAGFDPRFTLDGNFFIPETRTWKTVVREVIAYALFYIKAYCSFNREEREVRKLILRAAAFEQTWSSYCERYLVNDINDPCKHWIPLAEYRFLETIGALYKKSVDDSPSPRLFPREVMMPIHRMNKPQNTTWSDQQGLPYWENQDLNRMGWAFMRLKNASYTVAKGQLDTFEHGYVPHYIFAQAIRQPAEQLKEACRDLRREITGTTSSIKKAFSFGECQTSLNAALRQFNTAWANYVHSHELLTEAQMVFSQHDFRANLYRAYDAESKLNGKKLDETMSDGNRPSKVVEETTDQEIETAYQTTYAATKTGSFLLARV